MSENTYTPLFVDQAQADYGFLSAVLSLLDLHLYKTLLHVSEFHRKNRNDGSHNSTENEILSLIMRFPFSNETDDVDIDPDDEESLEKLTQDATAHLTQVAEDCASCGFVPRILQLQQIFGLSKVELAILMICIAPGIDIRYQKIFAFFVDNANIHYPSGELLLSLTISEGLDRLDHQQYLAKNAPLRRYHLIHNAYKPEAGGNLCNYFCASNAVVDWLLNRWNATLYPAGSELLLTDPDERAKNASQREEPQPPANMDAQTLPIFSFYGKDLIRQEIYAQRVAACMDMAFFCVMLPYNKDENACADLLTDAFRDAAMNHALLLLNGVDRWTESDGRWPQNLSDPLQDRLTPLVFNSKQLLLFPDAIPGRLSVVYRMEFDGLTAAARFDAWQTFLAEEIETSDSDVSFENLRQLAGRFKLTSGQIISAYGTAFSRAMLADHAIMMDDLYAGARLSSLHHLDDLAQKLKPRHEWDDLILPADKRENLQEMVSMVRNKALVLEDWQLGKKLAAGEGISALFTGPPGTGKTMAACVMAKELGLDIYRIDLSTVVSKYVGETEKNLEKIFTEAEGSNVILFFDEADALFGKRSEVKDAHDRYANIEVGYLLQRIEAYDGIAILATNLGANLDEAFTRRLHFIIDFPFPEDEYRLQLWQTMIPPLVPQEPDLNLERMAKRFRIAGGNIRNAIVQAVYLAAEEKQPLSEEYLIHGVRREFQKMGRVYKDDEFTLSV